MPKGSFVCQGCGQRLESAATPHTLSDCDKYTYAKQQAWRVGDNDAGWCAIVHAPTRAIARMKAQRIDLGDWCSYFAHRQPSLDGQLVTRESLVAAGWPERVEGKPLDVAAYIMDCGCPICEQSLELLNNASPE